MDEFDEIESKNNFRKMIFLIGGIIILAGVTTAFLIIKKGPKGVAPEEATVNSVLPTTETKPLFSSDISTWKNYYWPGKINTHYPSDWQFKEEVGKDGLVAGLEIVPPTNNVEDTIFIGGDAIKCADALKYSKNNCLKDKVQVPFYSNTKNQEVLNAFDLIFQNTILTEEGK
jgi:hypothetical protein